MRLVFFGSLVANLHQDDNRFGRSTAVEASATHPWGGFRGDF